jgi:hypothetical protein
MPGARSHGTTAPGGGLAVLEAALWGLVAASTLLVGALLAIALP